MVHALNITRSSENHEEFVTDSASIWHENSHGNMCPWLKKKLTYSIISFVSGFFSRTFQQLRQFRSFRYGRLVLSFFYANVTILMASVKYDRFLQVIAEHVTISGRCCIDHLTIFFAQNTRRPPISRNAFSINFYRIRVKIHKRIRVLKNKREIQNYEKLRVIGLFCYTRVFWCDMRVFPISYRQPELIMYDISFHHSLPFLPFKY